MNEQATPRNEMTMEKVTCPYCQSLMQEQDSALVYHGRSYGPILLCSSFPACDARVGIRNGKPLGTPANAELRKLRQQCHALFDAAWKSGALSRTDAYLKLQEIMDIPRQDAHISLFRVRSCRKFLDLWPKATLSALPLAPGGDDGE